MRRHLIAITLIAAMSALAFGQQGSVEQSIKGYMDELRLGSIHGDTAPFEKLLADDYYTVGIAGTILSKSDVLQSFKSGKLKYDAIDGSEEKVRLYGDTAIVNALYNIKGHFGDKDIGGQFRIVRVWVKRNGKWKNVSMQYTRVL